MPPHIFVTGATGFIGGYLLKALQAQGYQMSCLVHNPLHKAHIDKQGIRVELGSLDEHEKLRTMMRDADAVFHLAAMFKFGVRNSREMYKVNVEGTRTIFELAQELGTKKIIYCSTVAALGNTHDQIADENWPHDGQFQSEYCRTKYLAHEEAKRFISIGVPIINIMPSVVYGRGDNSTLGDSWRRYCQGKIPFVMAPDTRYTYVHVEDVVAGMLLAYERGKIGESYILAGEILSNRGMLDLLARLTGRAMPKLELPLGIARIAALFDETISKLFKQEPMLTQEAINMMEDCNWAVTSIKAQQQLGWQSRPIEEGLRDTFAEFISG